jgi:hypothetical protein
MGFTMFLRLPGYAAILLENQQNACYMLRLILGVDDDSDGGEMSFSLKGGNWLSRSHPPKGEIAPEIGALPICANRLANTNRFIL